MRYVVDTHTLVWHLTLDKRLGAQARRILDDESSLLIVPSIVLAEAKYIADHKRIPLTFQEILDQVTTAPNVTIFPLDEFVINHLPEMEIHDGIIVATGLYCKNTWAKKLPS